MTMIQPPQSHAADVFSDLPTLPAAENNKAPILAEWQALGFEQKKVLEIGSGTGQQGIHLCQHLPLLRWTPSEVSANFARLQQWWEASQKVGIINFLEPVEFEVAGHAIPDGEFDTVYTSNVLHIVSRDVAQVLINHVVELLQPGQKWVCYGPFKQHNQFTTQSNQDFNDWLLSEGHGGLMDLDDVVAFSNQQLEIEKLIEMPANNFMVIFNKL